LSYNTLEIEISTGKGAKMLHSLLGNHSPLAFRERTRPQVKTITPTELAGQLEQADAPLVVDVRTAGEYANDGHIAGSRLLPLSMLLSRSNELPHDRPIVFVCRSGNRSQVACEQLANLGFTNTINLVEGMIGWRRAGLPAQ
jgi:rhodanese-related sulfurtransferase